MGILTNFLKLLKPEPNDFVDVAKHISENYDKLDENAKSNDETLTNLNNNKLDKGTYSGNAGELKKDIDEKMSKYQTRNDIRDYDDLTEDGFYIVKGSVDGVINSPHWNISLVQVWNCIDAVYQKAVSYYEVQTQFTRCIVKKAKNTKWERIINTANYSLMCPYGIGDLMLSASSQHPAVRWVGTTWEKIEGRFLLATSGSNASGATGGSNTKTISKANLPNIKLQVDSFSVTTAKHTHSYIAFNPGANRDQGYPGGERYGNNYTTNTAEGGGENTGTASPYTNSLGSGTPLDITPAYYTVHIWKRIA